MIYNTTDEFNREHLQEEINAGSEVEEYHRGRGCDEDGCDDPVFIILSNLDVFPFLI